ncbi:MAG: enoyl-CoA hydratase/isomerase family protein [candidate division Zixibacteria bacterium]|nr:enoyl-CoA hydratase/isomerase family protein [candidate division Zixibacteria bacterium]
MAEYKTIILETADEKATIRLNCPDIRNAFNEVMIAELNEAVSSLKSHSNLRALILTGEGKSFCAGADLNWMKKMKDYTYEENLKDALALAELMYNIHSFPHPVIGRINGAAIGGGTGLVAACDIVVAAESAKFSFSEVKIGLVPACISPYVVMRVGLARSNRLFLTGERFKAKRALKYGLVDDVVPDDELDITVDGYVTQVLNSGPEAMSVSKELLRVVGDYDYEKLKQYTAEVIAKLRISEEGQEGLSAFLEKRLPKWIKE